MIGVDPDSPVQPAEQIRSQLAALVQSGELAADARLPTVRQLAADLRVAAGTVAKAYRDLEQAGLIRTGRAAGTRVNAGQATGVPVLAEARSFARSAVNAGLSLEEAQGILATAWNPPRAV